MACVAIYSSQDTLDYDNDEKEYEFLRLGLWDECRHVA